jgi:hypothetical protein
LTLSRDIVDISGKGKFSISGWINTGDEDDPEFDSL